MELNGSGEYRMVPFPADRKAIDIGDYYADYRVVQDRDSAGRLGYLCETD